MITPDQKILKTPGDLKLYIAKSGSVVDSNLVNFSLPKRTAKVDKMLSNNQKKKQATKQEMEIDDDIAISVSGSSPQKAKTDSSPQKAKTDENMELDHSRFSTEGKNFITILNVSSYSFGIVLAYLLNQFKFALIVVRFWFTELKHKVQIF